MHTIAIGCDPNAQEAKEKLMDFLKKKGYEITDSEVRIPSMPIQPSR